MSGSFSTLLASTVVNIAMPDIMGALGISPDQIQVVASAFLAAGTVTMLLTAWFIRTVGMAATYVGAMLVFLAGLLLGGFAGTAEVLFAARVIQGVGAGLMTPLSMILVAQVFPPQQRGFAMGIMSVGTILAPALGPTLGGFLVDHLSWRWVFLVIVPFGAITLPLALALLPGRERSDVAVRFDWPGTLLCTLFVVALLVALSDSQRYGWNDDGVLIALTTGIGALVSWIVWELRTPDPILDLRLLLNVRFLATAIVTFSVGIGLYGSTYLFPLFLQQISGFVPSESGVIMAPAGLAMAVLFPVSGYVSDLVSPRRMILVGMLIFTWSSYLMVAADHATPLATMVWWYVIGRIGLAFIFPSLNAAALNALTLAQLPQGSGMINFMRQLGGAFGVSFVSIAMTQRTALHQDYVAATQTWDNATTMELMRITAQELAALGLPARASFETAFAWVARASSQQALMLAYRDGFLLIAVVFTLTLIPAFFMADQVQSRSR